MSNHIKEHPVVLNLDEIVGLSEGSLWHLIKAAAQRAGVHFDDVCGLRAPDNLRIVVQERVQDECGGRLRRYYDLTCPPEEGELIFLCDEHARLREGEGVVQWAEDTSDTMLEIEGASCALEGAPV